MPLTSVQGYDSDKTEPWLPFSLSARFAIAVTGMAVYWWLASRQDVHKLIPLPLFNERVGQIAPTLIEGALGILFSIWFIALAWEYKAHSTSKLTAVPSMGDPISAHEREWRSGKWTFLAAYILIVVVGFSGNALKFLWPSYPLNISLFARLVLDLLALAGFSLAWLKKKPQDSLTESANVSEPES